MRTIWKRLAGGKCEHSRTVVVTSVGVRRSVCSDCGHISFAMLSRSAPAPPSDQPDLKDAVGL